MSLWCIQIFNVADVNASAEDVTCCPEHKLHLDVKDMQGQGGHRWLVHLRAERGASLSHIQLVGGGSGNCFVHLSLKLRERERSKSQAHPAGVRWVE